MGKWTVEGSKYRKGFNADPDKEDRMESGGKRNLKIGALHKKIHPKQ